ncbi:MAG: NAD(P)H-hydrate dehydratase [Flavisolibacter sp.]
MYVLTAGEIRAWDAYTIQHEPVVSIDLMERAAAKCVEWIGEKAWEDIHFKIFCGKGNNGGDGLAIARMLSQKGFPVTVYILEFGKPGTGDFQINLQRLHECPVDIHYLQQTNSFPELQASDLVIDALFGSGLNKPLEGLAAELVQHMNGSLPAVVSIDLPSGLFADRSSKGQTMVEADYVLTFQCYKPGLLVPENAPFTGVVQVLDIGLHPGFLTQRPARDRWVDKAFADTIFLPRSPFAHKGDFGHALLIAGSYGKMGAAVLAAKACLHTGAGLTSVYAPKCGYEILQTSVPEAMVMTDKGENDLGFLPDELDRYAAIGIGPGIGTKDGTQDMLAFVIRRFPHRLVIDADGLNCLAARKDLLSHLPPKTVLTPHPREFDRLFGDHQNDFARMATAKEQASALGIVIVLKGHHTLIATPDGHCYFNSTGNAGMAKGGSGDVLTGIITALLAQKYLPVEAAVLGVFLHGHAGDLAAGALSQEAMVATDIITFLSQSFLKFQTRPSLSSKQP